MHTSLHFSSIALSCRQLFWCLKLQYQSGEEFTSLPSLPFLIQLALQGLVSFSSSSFSIPVLVKCNNLENFSFPKINRNVYPFLSIPSDFDGFFFLFYNFADQSTWWSSGSYSRTSCPYTVQKLRSLVY